MSDTTVREFRKGNVFLVVVPEQDGFFWQYQEGARKRMPFASGVSDAATTDKMIERFAGKEI